MLEMNHEKPKNRSHVAQPKWSNALRNEKYLQITSNKLSQMEKFQFPTSGTQNLKEIFNKRFETINDILRNTASEAGCIPHKTLQPKAYWCPELSALRDKKTNMVVNMGWLQQTKNRNNFQHPQRPQKEI